MQPQILKGVAELADIQQPQIITDNYRKVPRSVGPKILHDIAAEKDTTCNQDPNYTIFALLGAAAVAIGAKFEAANINGNHIAIAAFFIVFIGNSGIAKSGPIKDALKPVKVIDGISFKRFSEMKEAREQWEKLPEKDRKAFDEPPKAVLEQIVYSDITLESGKRGLCENKNGVCWDVGEINALRPNKYKSNDGGAIQELNTIWDGDGLIINRATGVQRSEKSRLTILTTTQPELAAKAFSGDAVSSGYTPRWCIVFPSIEAKRYPSQKEVNKELLRSWDNIINRIVEIPAVIDDYTGEIVPYKFQLSSEARAISYKWACDNVDISNEADEDAVKAICSKLDIMLYRFALVLQVLFYVTEGGSNSIIEAKAMSGAVELIEYCRWSSLRLLSIINGDNPLQGLRADQAALYNNLPVSFRFSQAVDVAQKIWVGVKPETIKTRLKALFKNKSLFTSTTGGNYTKLVIE